MRNEKTDIATKVPKHEGTQSAEFYRNLNLVNFGVLVAEKKMGFTTKWLNLNSPG
jgi:hypothetical protein